MLGNKMIDKNRKCWNIDYKSFDGWCCLPSWGPYNIGSNEAFFGPIVNKSFLEIACGSGHSIKYLLEQGAAKVIGVDFSHKQLELAKKLLINNRGYELIESNMEKKLDVIDLDYVFSIYGIGWSTDISTTINNIYGYLTVGGKFIFSWDHSFYTCLEQVGDNLQVNNPYHSQKYISMSNWGDEGDTAYVLNNTIGEWYELLRSGGFEVEKILEPAPLNLDEEIEKQSVDITSYYSRDKVKLIPPTIIFVCKKI